VRPGDVLLAVDGAACAGLSREAAEQRMVGARGGKVRLHVESGAAAPGGAGRARAGAFWVELRRGAFGAEHAVVEGETPT